MAKNRTILATSPKGILPSVYVRGRASSSSLGMRSADPVLLIGRRAGVGRRVEISILYITTYAVWGKFTVSFGLIGGGTGGGDVTKNNRS